MKKTLPVILILLLSSNILGQNKLVDEYYNNKYQGDLVPVYRKYNNKTVEIKWVKTFPKILIVRLDKFSWNRRTGDNCISERIYYEEGKGVYKVYYDVELCDGTLLGIDDILAENDRKIEKENNENARKIAELEKALEAKFILSPNYTKYQEATEDAVISSIRASLETYATEQLMSDGRRTWPTNPWDALETKPDGYVTPDGDATDNGQWRFNSSTANITHIRGDGTLVHWDYYKGIQRGNTAGVGTMGSREEGVGN